MLEPDESEDGAGMTADQASPPVKKAAPRRRRAASRPAGPPEELTAEPEPSAAEPVVAPEAAEPVVESEAVVAEAAEPEPSAATLVVKLEASVPESEASEPEVVEAAAEVVAEVVAEEPDPANATPSPLFAPAFSPAPAFAAAPVEPRRRRRATAAAGPPAADTLFAPPPAAEPAAAQASAESPTEDVQPAEDDAPRPRGRSAARGRRRGAAVSDGAVSGAAASVGAVSGGAAVDPQSASAAVEPMPAPDVNAILDLLPEAADAPRPGRRRSRGAAKQAAAPQETPDDEATRVVEPDQDADTADSDDDSDPDDESGARPRRRRRGGRTRRGRRTGGDGDEAGEDAEAGTSDDEDSSDDEPDGDGSDGDGSENEDVEGEDTEGDDAGRGGGTSRSSRRRRRRRRSTGSDADLAVDPDDPPGTVVKIRESRNDEVTKLKGSTRLEAKRQRRRDGRGTQRKRTVITEAEFLARRESVDRTLLVRERDGRTQIAVLEDGVLVEHYVTRASQQSMIGNVYLGKVQNVLPSMEAAFIDVGRGRNAVLYAGEVNWDAAGLDNGAARKIEAALKPGDPVLGQVSKDPVGHKGARLTAQISLPGRYLVYVPNGSMTGISRKLPELERNRLKKVLRRVVPEGAGVIVRTAAEGASEEELERDVNRLRAQWEDIEKKSRSVAPPTRLYAEPDLAIKVVRDVFNEDFTRLVVSGDDTWDTLDGYVRHVAPDLAERMSRWSPEADAEQDLFVHHRVEEQIAKAVDRKVWLPSGGSLVIDRTEAMTVVDVNTGKYTGSGGNLEETVTKNNLEAAEEIVRQLRLRDIGGMIVVDFIDMVLESNRNLVLRRLVECLGRDRTKHQVAEVTSLGLVQMTRKKVGQGLVEAFSTECEHCQGRGIMLHTEPIGIDVDQAAASSGPESGRGGRRPGGRS